MKTSYLKPIYIRLFFSISGLLATIWFLIRVIPKPTRAFYPCQKAAFPFATSFIIWLVGSSTSLVFIKNIRKKHNYKKLSTSLMLVTGCLIFLVSYMIAPTFTSYASNSVQKEELPLLKAEQASTTDHYKSTVAIVRSEKANSSDINASDIQTLVEQAVTMAGGLNDIVHNGDTVVIKPNLVIDYSYAGNQKLTPGANGIVTDYRVIQAVVNIVNQLNPSGKIFLMEGSAKGHTLNNMATVGWDDITGLDGTIAIEESSGGWYEYNSPNLVGVDLSNDVALYPDYLKPNNTRTIYQNKIYHNADVLICIPVLKNHGYTGITGAVKCVGIGGTPGKIYGTGPSDADPTQRYGIDHGNENSARTNLHKWIHDFYACRPIDFVVMDGLQGSDRGPVAYGYTTVSQAQKNMRVILAGRDAIAVDVIESLIMKHDPSKIAHLVYLHNDDYGCANPALINVIGTQVEDIRTDFKIYDSGTQSKFSNASCRDYIIENPSFSDDKLSFSIADSTNLSRIEVSIDGQLYTSMIIGQFNHVSIPLNGFTLTDSIVSIKLIDRFLYTLTKYYNSDFSGIHEISPEDADFKIFPNPCKDYLAVQSSSLLNKNCKIEIFSLNGNLLFSSGIIRTASFTKEIDCSGLSKGNYIVRLTSNNKTISQIMLKQ